MQVPFKLAKRLLLVWAGSSLSMVLVSGQLYAAEAEIKNEAANSTADPVQNQAKPVTTTREIEISEGESLGSFVVTAQRREQKASEVPLALTVVTGDDLSRSTQIKQTNDIVNFVPNAQAAQTNAPSRARWFIRGIGTNNTGNNTINPIGIYYDDVYIANINNQGWPLFDIAHVEVLNGPQGTLWGKNSNGGAINYVSRKPKFTPDASARITIGSDNLREVEGAVGGGLIDDVVAGRVAFYSRTDDGWQKNTTTGQNHGGGNDVATRAQLLITPNSDLDITLNAHTRDFSGLPLGADYKKSTVTPLTSSTPTQKAYLSVYPNGLQSTGWGVTADANITEETLEARGANAKINWDLGFAKLTSITAYETNDFGSGGGSAPIPTTSKYYNNGIPFTLGYGLSTSKQISQEFRLTSPNEGRLTWLGGLYAFKGSQDTRSISANYVRGDSTTTANAWGTGPQYTDTKYTQDSESYAVFGNVGYDVTDQFKVGGGIRRSYEKISIDWNYSAANIAGTAASFINNLPTTNIQNFKRRDVNYTDSDSQNNSSWTYDFTPEYKFSEQLRVYGRYAHGVLPGGYTNTGYIAVPGTKIKANQLFPLKPEELDAYEAGFKTSWLDKKLFLDFTAFYYDYKNLVVNVPTVLDPANPTVTTVLFRNAGASEIKGIEVRGEANPVKNFYLRGSFGFLDSEYTQDTGNTATILGAQAPRSPRFTANLSGNYQYFLPTGGSLVFGGDVNWRSKYYYYPTVESQITKPDPLLWQEAYAVFNAQLIWNIDKKENFALQFSVLNATNTEYTNHALPVSNGSSNQLYGKPRSYELSLNAKF